jgi:formate/nitrite transporter FocA (FNT family)
MKREKPHPTSTIRESPAINTRAEEKKVEERLAIGPHIVYETIRREGEEEFKRTSSALAWSGLAAGLSMGFSLVAEALLAAHLPHASWTRLISKFGYSVGFLIVILGRQQLFTETTLTVIIPLLSRQTLRKIRGVLRIWGVILGANLFGTFVFALCIARIAIFDSSTRQALTDVSQEALGTGFATVLVRAVFAGWLIALMVWLLPAADSSRVSIIIILTYLIGLGGFNHIIAGSSI